MCLMISYGLVGWAMHPLPGSPGYVPPPPPPAGTMKAAACAPASQITQLSVNNVRAVIENGGNVWQRRALGRSGYEVPKTPDFTGPNAIFAGALWMGGISPDNQLKMAAVLYRTDGNDFWPGPLNTDDASVTPDVCSEFDKFWQTSRMQAETHVQYFNCAADPDCDLDEIFPNGYSIPTAFLNWPAIGNVDAGQDLYLAPFIDADEDGFYDPTAGDYPDYGFDLTVEDCLTKDRQDPVPLFGDDNIYWIFNDKGDAHTETQGQPIGLEVRAQAFSFNSNDEINNMSFYNYVVINQGSQTLTNTYFGHFVDPDLGCSNDDFAGCDVQRGLGFVYNWDDQDVACLGAPGYGGPNPPPPAVGIDFFEGPFQDADDFDNPGPAQGLTCQEYQLQKGIPYKGLGIGYGDGVNDNERFGMRAYIYFNREGNTNLTDPSNAAHFYNYLRSIWKNNVPQTYGGTGYSEAPGSVRAYYMFPWDSDPIGWGTNCVPQAPWQENDQGNLVDRRFIQSAGPFTLEPGAYNNVTVGVVWARAATGNNITSVDLMRIADDKAQALFDNCFKILDGPDAPDLEITELDRELIIHLINPPGSNNENEAYEELDPTIPETDTAGNAHDRYYRFQGYLLYQLKDATVSVADLADPNSARLIYQADVEDGIGQIINYPFNQTIGMAVPTEMVNGSDEGIAHSIRVTEDAFAQGSPQLVNFKTYYFLALTYGYNNYEDFDLAAGIGQAFPFVAGRKAAFGAIRAYSGIPHKPAPQNGGTIQIADFGDMMPITRLEGQGNGGNILEIEASSVNAILDGSPWRENVVNYVEGRSPVQVKVVDPLSVPDSQFEIWFNDGTPENLDDASWMIVRLTDQPTSADTVRSERTIDFNYEQLLLHWGLSVTIDQTFTTGSGVNRFAPPIGSGIVEFADPNKAWFTGIPDIEGEVPQNWIRSGQYDAVDANEYDDRPGKDDEQIYENVLAGTWAPWALVGWAPFQPSNQQQSTLSQSTQTLGSASLISETPSIQLVITKDKSKWTRSVVLEQEANTSLSEGGAAKLALRASPSVDKEGRRPGENGVNEAEATMNGTQPTGAGWFPGYAIDVETGERLNIAFGENSFWGGDRGRDMLWNPDSVMYTPTGSPYFGGSHWIYVFKNQRRIENQADRVGVYDEAQYIYQRLTSAAVSDLRNVFRSVAWVGSALVATGTEFMATDVKILLSVEKPYARYVAWPGIEGPDPATDRNNGLPLYTFGTGRFAVQEDVHEVAENSLDIINVVPNPYYAFSGYETSRLDNRIKFINLPQTCTISIFNVGGTLVRKFRKDNELTYLDWDLKNMHNVPIAGGAYICHIEVPGVGEKVLKWFGVMRPLDLQNF